MFYLAFFHCVTDNLISLLIFYNLRININEKKKREDEFSKADAMN